jgi:hypothetical protein
VSPGVALMAQGSGGVLGPGSLVSSRSHAVEGPWYPQQGPSPGLAQALVGGMAGTARAGGMHGHPGLQGGGAPPQHEQYSGGSAGGPMQYGPAHLLQHHQHHQQPVLQQYGLDPAAETLRMLPRRPDSGAGQLSTGRDLLLSSGGGWLAGRADSGSSQQLLDSMSGGGGSAAGSMSRQHLQQLQQQQHVAPDLKMMEIIGCGGFGAVYKGFWRGMVVAVKVGGPAGRGKRQGDAWPGLGCTVAALRRLLAGPLTPPAAMHQSSPLRPGGHPHSWPSAHQHLASVHMHACMCGHTHTLS